MNAQFQILLLMIAGWGNGLPAAPARVKQTTWRQFLKAHWDGLLAADFCTTEVLSLPTNSTAHLPRLDRKVDLRTKAACGHLPTSLTFTQMEDLCLSREEHLSTQAL